MKISWSAFLGFSLALPLIPAGLASEEEYDQGRSDVKFTAPFLRRRWSTNQPGMPSYSWENSELPIHYPHQFSNAQKYGMQTLKEDYDKEYSDDEHDNQHGRTSNSLTSWVWMGFNAVYKFTTAVIDVLNDNTEEDFSTDYEPKGLVVNCVPDSAKSESGEWVPQLSTQLKISAVSDQENEPYHSPVNIRQASNHVPCSWPLSKDENDEGNPTEEQEESSILIMDQGGFENPKESSNIDPANILALYFPSLMLRSSNIKYLEWYPDNKDANQAPKTDPSQPSVRLNNVEIREIFNHFLTGPINNSPSLLPYRSLQKLQLRLGTNRKPLQWTSHAKEITFQTPPSTPQDQEEADERMESTVNSHPVSVHKADKLSIPNFESDTDDQAYPPLAPIIHGYDQEKPLGSFIVDLVSESSHESSDLTVSGSEETFDLIEAQGANQIGGDNSDLDEDNEILGNDQIIIKEISSRPKKCDANAQDLLNFYFTDPSTRRLKTAEDAPDILKRSTRKSYTKYRQPTDNRKLHHVGKARYGQKKGKTIKERNFQFHKQRLSDEQDIAKPDAPRKNSQNH